MVEFKVGERVYSVTWGWGVVDRMINNDSYPVLVKFDCNQIISHTVDGKHNKYALRTLFFEEIPIPESALVRKHQFTENQLVWWTDYSGIKRLRIIASVNNNLIRLFSEGRDSGDTFSVNVNELKPYDNQ